VTTEQVIALLVALTGLIAALTRLFVQVRQTHQLINSRMDQLLELTRASALAAGRLEGVASQASGVNPPRNVVKSPT
jgi:hypothetical protein